MVKPKKHLGQHFLNDDWIAQKTADLVQRNPIPDWLEIGPGTGRLTRHLLQQKIRLQVVELDRESVHYLKAELPDLSLIEGDFLQMNLPEIMPSPMAVIGNFPYNISSQIVFKALDHVDQVQVLCGMFQLEVAQRLAASPNSKTYGILSVLTQAWYDVSIEFTIPPEAFNPPPKVHSAVIYAHRHHRLGEVNRNLFFDVVKTAFQQRRKMLSNALRKFNLPDAESELVHLLKLRAENLSVNDFVQLTNFFEVKGK